MMTDLLDVLPAALMISGFFLALGGGVLVAARWMDHRILDRPTLAMSAVGIAVWGSGLYSAIS